MNLDDSIKIVIPFYHTSLSNNEQISFERANDVFQKENIILLAPERMRGSDILLRQNVIFFPDHYLESTGTYSELLLSQEFYESFADCQYILIYQLDAFVFKDNLMEFCNAGYDYIGAPEPLAYDWEAIGTRVGNGGLSLRNVKACLRMVSRKEEILQKSPVPETMLKQEDLFFSFCGAAKSIDFTTPSAKIANQFSCEYNLGNCFEQHDKQLPFGCHAWHRIEYEHWKYYIEKYGYKTEKGNQAYYTESQSKYFAMYKCIKRFLQEMDRNPLNQIFDLVKPNERKIAIWGAGDDGKNMTDILDRIGIPYIILDRYKYNDQTILNPTAELLSSKNYRIIVASLKYMDEMISNLTVYGLKYLKDYCLCSDIYKIITDGYSELFESSRALFLSLE